MTKSDWELHMLGDTEKSAGDTEKSTWGHWELCLGTLRSLLGDTGNYAWRHWEGEDITLAKVISGDRWPHTKANFGCFTEFLASWEFGPCGGARFNLRSPSDGQNLREGAIWRKGNTYISGSHIKALAKLFILLFCWGWGLGLGGHSRPQGTPIQTKCPRCSVKPTFEFNMTPFTP